MVKCPKCNKENIEDSKFCFSCGADLSMDYSHTNYDKLLEVNTIKIEDIQKKLGKNTTTSKMTDDNEKMSLDSKKNNFNMNNVGNKINNVKNKSFFQKLFYKKNKNQELVFSKTKLISFCVFTFFFIYALFTVNAPNFIVYILVSIIIGLIYSVPCFILGFIIRKIIEYLRN